MSSLPPRPYIAFVYNPGCKSLDDCEADYRHDFNRIVEAVDYCTAKLADGSSVAKIKRFDNTHPPTTVWGPVHRCRAGAKG